MGKELPLAREEEEGQSVLLASSGIGEFGKSSTNRDKGKKESSAIKGSKGGKVKDTKAKSKGSIKAEGANAITSKRQRRRRGNQDRKQGGGDEGEYRKVRRSSQELGVTFPGSYCDDAKITPHYWLESGKVEKGSLFQCKFCHRYLWLPLSTYDANVLGKLMRTHGSTEGYCQYLNRHRPAKLLMAKLQDLRRLEMEITDKMEFARLADRILSDKDYDRKE